MPGLADWLRGWRTPLAKQQSAVAAGPLDFSEPGFVQNPYPYFARLRDAEPLHRSASGAWVFSRRSDILAALADPRLGNAPAPYAIIGTRNRDRYPCAEVAGNTLPFLDGPLHTRLRRLFAQAWTTQLRENPPDIETHARRLAAQCRAKGRFDLLREFATPLAVAVIGDVLGVPDTMRPALHADARFFFYLFTHLPSHEVRAQTDAAVLRLREGFGRLLDDPEAAPQGVIAGLRGLEANELSPEQVLDNLALLWADGIGNVDSGIASAFAVLLQHPKQWRALCAEPTLSANAAAECLRFESPGQFIGRVVLEDLDWHGQALKRGQVVLLVLASANHDQHQHPDAQRFDIHGSGPSALSFGRGHHSCVGAALARSEVEVALRVAAEELPQLRLCVRTLEWQLRIGHRWLNALPVAVD
ncbi:MAG: cytochrome P450 [Immundisolibacter sp.]|uniref:cytochrome P450 n=1 Tax=Immundisolibacter sp. TaxID=1934948 RepID=UPI003EE2EED3